MNSAWHGNEDIMAEKVDYGTLKKGGFMRQKQKNNFSLRLAVVGGYLTAENLTKIAEVAEKYGDGHVHLTSRQGVEIPFIKLKDIDAVKEELAEGGCRPGVCGPRVRTVTACQGNTICPSGNIDSYDIAVKLDERYFGRELPHKFKFGVTGCQTTVLRQRRMMLVSRVLLMLSGLKTNVLAVAYVRRPVVQVQSQCRTARWQLIMTNVITAADVLNPVQQMRGTHLMHISFHLQEHLVIL